MIEDPITHEQVEQSRTDQSSFTTPVVPIVNGEPTISDGSSIPDSREWYHVCRGTESLESVAAENGLTADDLLDLNAGNPALSQTAWPVGSFIRVK